MKTSDRVADIILIVVWLFPFAIWLWLFVGSIVTLGAGAGLFLMITGIFIIVLGYYSKLRVKADLGSAYFKESIEILRKKQKLNEKISLNHKLELWILDGYVIKVCNKLGLSLLAIGFVVLIIGLLTNTIKVTN